MYVHFRSDGIYPPLNSRCSESNLGSNGRSPSRRMARTQQWLPVLFRQRHGVERDHLAHGTEREVRSNRARNDRVGGSCANHSGFLERTRAQPRSVSCAIFCRKHLRTKSSRIPNAQMSPLTRWSLWSTLLESKRYDLLLIPAECWAAQVNSRLVAQQMRDPRPDGSYNEAQRFVLNHEQTPAATRLAYAFDFTLHRQVATADVILLNKVDLVSPSDVPRIESAIR
jgi:hypothetical protein